MFELLDAIPVTFGPHEGDVWMITATLMSFSASLVVAVVAARNGQKATKIAEDSVRIAREANDRDEAHRMQTRQDRADEKRSEIAFAIALAFNAEEYRTDPAIQSDEVKRTATVQANQLLLEASAKVDLIASLPERKALRKWLLDSIFSLREIDRSTDYPDYSEDGAYELARQAATAKLALWNASALEAKDL
ncbi:hypothetical protein EDF60_1665 [Leucobacter luti]|uniref:hypothetical protein n=1 Tax=Leucobacter luti TaxID=340320 RepID=UPI00104F3438|nr:hypothetical protein [Leucobacter luti]MCW2287014.1 hypothetical protein [Leucobacter luti]TCK41239.1 hypothetical protein EDF60_1665 [Leucobacter luti]